MLGSARTASVDLWLLNHVFVRHNIGVPAWGCIISVSSASAPVTAPNASRGNTAMLPCQIKMEEQLSIRSGDVVGSSEPRPVNVYVRHGGWNRRRTALDVLGMIITLMSSLSSGEHHDATAECCSGAPSTYRRFLLYPEMILIVFLYNYAAYKALGYPSWRNTPQGASRSYETV